MTKREPITLGFDGSVSDDSTALVGCRVSDGMLFLIKLESAPDGPEKATWRVNRDAFDGMVRWMMDNYNVVGFFADVAYFEQMIGGWEKDYGKKLKVGPRKGGDKIKFWTNNWHKDMQVALDNAHTAFRYPYTEPERKSKPIKDDIALLADPRLVNHFRNARSGRLVLVMRFIRSLLIRRTRLMRAWLACWLIRRVESIWNWLTRSGVTRRRESTDGRGALWQSCS